ncbi:MAG: ABC transporter substrate-binding protein [Deltaproteobacteria bacterium]|nr:ABC transporter substrate-binding protein [Deltaproteobacteria bacterium]
MKTHTYIYIGLFIAAVAVAVTVHFVRAAKVETSHVSREISCERVVSLAPSITEMVFALELGNRLVGVTRFCDYPAEARAKPKIGGYADPSYELVLRSRPDVVFLLNLHEKQREHLARLEIETVTLNADTISGIFESIHKIATVCSVQPRGDRLTRSMQNRLAKIKELTKDKNRPRVLVSLGRSMGSNSIKEIFVAGKGTFFNEVVEMAGGQNAVQSQTVMYPRLSAEGVIDVNPEIIIDLVVDLEQKAIIPDDIIKQWRGAASTDAVRNQRVHVLSQDYVVVPGPRVVLLVEQIARLLHPDLDWSRL